MSDKEERIYIRIFTEHPCKQCSDRDSVFCSCGLYHKYANAKIRQQAIEAMARALCSSECYANCEGCAMEQEKLECKQFLISKGYVEKAEAALEALLKLGGKK